MSSIEGDYFIPDNTQLDDSCLNLKNFPLNTRIRCDKTSFHVEKKLPYQKNWTDKYYHTKSCSQSNDIIILKFHLWHLYQNIIMQLMFLHLLLCEPMCEIAEHIHPV